MQNPAYKVNFLRTKRRPYIRDALYDHVHEARFILSNLMEPLSHCSVPGPDAVRASGGRPGAEVQHGGAAVPRVEGGRRVHRGGRLDQGQHAPLPVATRRGVSEGIAGSITIWGHSFFYLNGKYSCQLFVVVLDTCRVWGMLVLPSDAQVAPSLPYLSAPDTSNQRCEYVSLFLFKI